MQNQIEHTSTEKKDCHSRDDGNGKFFNPLTSLHEDQAHHKGDGDGAGDGRNVKNLFACVGDGIGLCGAADTESGQTEGCTVKDCQYRTVQKIVKDIHRTAVVLPTQAVTQPGFGVGCSHTQYTGNPAPEHGSRPSQKNGCRNPYDIPGA